MYFISALVVVAAVFAIYVRAAPVRPADWHVVPAFTEPGDYPRATGFIALRKLRATGADALRAIDTAAAATPRTKLIAGSLQEGMLTYETRTRFMAFPDYTTVAVDDDMIAISARLRFGKSDFGVNKARVQSWLQALAPLTEPL
ncbi:DUF1499 domain-containing protein [Loktanella sp. S4079]|uniref:DUF1499 domain-containing protein n=1 Tax=Loktanella sp. S4079 TaxID=579483 RepID=UPI0005F9C499|nr:DUF1499 domain-containing protein [Loktanella sp. S4079]KJZ20263.1 hypothetical protein TW80_05420 [Loktanella sp. S4079]